MDEKDVLNIQKKYTLFITLEAKKEKIIQKLKGDGKLTDELESLIRGAEKMSVLEDIYAPFKSKYPFLTLVNRIVILPSVS